MPPNTGLPTGGDGDAFFPRRLRTPRRRRLRPRRIPALGLRDRRVPSSASDRRVDAGAVPGLSPPARPPVSTPNSESGLRDRSDSEPRSRPGLCSGRPNLRRRRRRGRPLPAVPGRDFDPAPPDATTGEYPKNFSNRCCARFLGSRGSRLGFHLQEMSAPTNPLAVENLIVAAFGRSLRDCFRNDDDMSHWLGPFSLTVLYNTPTADGMVVCALPTTTLPSTRDDGAFFRAGVLLASNFTS